MCSVVLCSDTIFEIHCDNFDIVTTFLNIWIGGTKRNNENLMYWFIFILKTFQYLTQDRDSTMEVFLVKIVNSLAVH